MPDMPSDPDQILAQCPVAASLGASPHAPQCLLAMAELQDKLTCARDDLDRLQTLLTDATQTLMDHFCSASTQINQMASQARQSSEPPDQALCDAMAHLGGAVTALQFQDMASQLIVHTNQRLRSCADGLALEGRGDGAGGNRCVGPSDAQGRARVRSTHMPRRGPVSQDRMRAGSVELF